MSSIKRNVKKKLLPRPEARCFLDVGRRHLRIRLAVWSIHVRMAPASRHRDLSGHCAVGNDTGRRSQRRLSRTGDYTQNPRRGRFRSEIGIYHKLKKAVFSATEGGLFVSYLTIQSFLTFDEAMKLVTEPDCRAPALFLVLDEWNLRR